MPRAEALLLRALGLCRAGSYVLGEISLLPELCSLYVKTGRLAQAEPELQRAQEILAMSEDWFGLAGDVALAEGMVRAAEGRWPEADAAFARAQSIYQQYELKWDEAKLYYEWGCVLAPYPDTPSAGPFPQRGQGEQDEARERRRALLGRAMEMWDTMGAGPWADKCRERLVGATPP